MCRPNHRYINLFRLNKSIVNLSNRYAHSILIANRNTIVAGKKDLVTKLIHVCLFRES